MSRPPARTVRLAALGLLLAPSTGCVRDTPPSAVPTTTAPGAAAKSSRDEGPTAADGVTTYRLTGLVKRVNPKEGLVTIRHDAIPGFMGAMTMPFELKDRAQLEDVREGDEVEGELRVEREKGEVKDFELRDLVVSRPAPAAALTLKVGDGPASVAPAPRLLKAGEPVPDFAMTGQDGKAFRLSDLRGKVVALTFVYTRCPLPTFCPMLDAKFAAASERASAVASRAGRLAFLSVSFDPEHDSPEALARHAKARGAVPPLWSFAVARHAELAKVAGPLGLAYGPGRDEVMHNLVVAVVGPDGRLVRLETGPAARSLQPADLLKTMYSQLPRASG